jgi:predicted RNA-binding protein
MDYVCAIPKENVDNYNLGVTYKVWGVIEAYKAKIAKVRRGDRVFFVVDGTLRSVHSVESEPFDEQHEIWPPHAGDQYHGSVYPHRVRISSAALISYAPMSWIVDRLKLTKALKNWSGALQGPNGVFRPIKSDDAALLEEHMKRHLCLSFDDLLHEQ